MSAISATATKAPQQPGRQHRLTPASTSADAAGAMEKPILAERYKTKLCKNFEQAGDCPYIHRCMFAHGRDELRTKQQNLSDGLTSEDAIMAHRRACFRAEQQAAKRKQAKPTAPAAATAPTASASSSRASPAAQRPRRCVVADGSAPATPTPDASFVTPQPTTASPPTSLPSLLVSLAEDGGASDSDSESSFAELPGSAVALHPHTVGASSAFDTVVTPRSPRAPRGAALATPYDTAKYVSPLAAAMLGARA